MQDPILDRILGIMLSASCYEDASFLHIHLGELGEKTDLKYYFCNNKLIQRAMSRKPDLSQHNLDKWKLREDVADLHGQFTAD